MRQEENLGYKYLKKELEEVMELLTPRMVMDAGNGGRVEVLACQQWGRWRRSSIGPLCGDGANNDDGELAPAAA